MARPTILVVDGDVFHGAYVTTVLAARGWIVRGPVRDPASALDLLAREPAPSAAIVEWRGGDAGTGPVLRRLHERGIPALTIVPGGVTPPPAVAHRPVLAAPFAAWQAADWVAAQVGPPDDDGAVLVTGGAGYIGSHAVLALLDAGRRVVVIDNLTTGFARAVDPRATLVIGDVGDDLLVRRTLHGHGVTAVMHFAGSVVVPASVADPLGYYRNNTVASRALIESAVACGVRHFIFSSTAATYGLPEIVPIPEDSAKAPINPYGTSKLMTEFMLRDVAAAHPLNYCALRYFNVAGADRAGRSGQSTAGATHLIKIAAEAATGKRGHVSVYGTDFATADGTGVRDYIHVSDLAAAHVDALALLIARPDQSHVMNCGYGRGFSVMQVLDAVDHVAGIRLERRMEGRRAGDPDTLIADNRRILATLPWRPAHDDLHGIVRDAIAWERTLPAPA